MRKSCQGVFAGGGVRGIGHVGAVLATEEAGYCFKNVAGSSAGAIVAALLAAGYSTEELHRVMQDTDYRKMKQGSWLSRLGMPGKAALLLYRFGIYRADYFEVWMAELLQRKKIKTFGDLPSDGKEPFCCLQLTATDLLTRRLLILPQDFALFGLNPMSYPIAKAVRMSMSIPFFYAPYPLRDADGRLHYLVDGGVVSNYPIWLLDPEERAQKMPTFGYRFYSPKERQCPECRTNANFAIYARAVVAATLDGYDNHAARSGDADDRQSIWISTKIRQKDQEREISATDFEITKEEGAALFENGYRAGKDFFDLRRGRDGKRETVAK